MLPDGDQETNNQESEKRDRQITFLAFSSNTPLPCTQRGLPEDSCA